MDTDLLGLCTIDKWVKKWRDQQISARKEDVNIRRDVTSLWTVKPVFTQRYETLIPFCNPKMLAGPFPSFPALLVIQLLVIHLISACQPLENTWQPLDQHLISHAIIIYSAARSSPQPLDLCLLSPAISAYSAVRCAPDRHLQSWDRRVRPRLV